MSSHDERAGKRRKMAHQPDDEAMSMSTYSQITRQTGGTTVQGNRVQPPSWNPGIESRRDSQIYSEQRSGFPQFEHPGHPASQYRPSNNPQDSVSLMPSGRQVQPYHGHWPAPRTEQTAFEQTRSQGRTFADPYASADVEAGRLPRYFLLRDPVEYRAPHVPTEKSSAIKNLVDIVHHRGRVEPRDIDGLMFRNKDSETLEDLAQAFGVCMAHINGELYRRDFGVVGPSKWSKPLGTVHDRLQPGTVVRISISDSMYDYSIGIGNPDRYSTPYTAGVTKLRYTLVLKVEQNSVEVLCGTSFKGRQGPPFATRKDYTRLSHVAKEYDNSQSSDLSRAYFDGFHGDSLSTFLHHSQPRWINIKKPLAEYGMITPDSFATIANAMRLPSDHPFRVAGREQSDKNMREREAMRAPSNRGGPGEYVEHRIPSAEDVRDDRDRDGAQRAPTGNARPRGAREGYQVHTPEDQFPGNGQGAQSERYVDQLGGAESDLEEGEVFEEDDEPLEYKK